MVRIALFVSLLFATITVAVADSLIASVDKNPVAVNESLTLTLTYNGNPDHSPDLSELKNNFILSGTSQYQSTNIVNGKTTSAYSWVINLMPRQVGTFEIPAFQIGSVQSDGIKISVLGVAASASATTEKIRIEVSVDKTEPYVDEQVIITMKLTRPYDAKERGLSRDDQSFNFESIGKPKEYTTLDNGIRLAHTEVQFVLFPDKIGTLIIPSVIYSVDVLEGQSRSAFSRRFRNYKNRAVRSEPKTLKVKPRPAGIQTQWLPSSALTLSASWEPDTNEIKSGDPITWTLVLTAKGIKHEALPDISMPELPDLSWYPDKPEGENIIDNGFTGKKIFKFALVPSAAGEIQLPRIEIPWWDVNKDEAQVAAVPSKRLVVTPANQAIREVPTLALSKPEAASEQNPAKPTIFEQDSNLWQTLTLIFGFAWLFTLAYLWQLKRRLFKAKTKLVNHSADKEVSWKQLLELCKRSDAKTAEQALLAWSNRDSAKRVATLSLDELANSVDNSSLANAIRELEKILYGKQSEPWDPSALVEQLKVSKIELHKSNDTDSNRVLGSYELNPTI